MTLRRGTWGGLAFAAVLTVSFAVAVAGLPGGEGVAHAAAKKKAAKPKDPKGKDPKGKDPKGKTDKTPDAPPTVSTKGSGLEILCFTKDADIYVDDKPIGKTPLDKPHPLPPGKYTVKVKKPGYSDFIDVILVTPDTPTLVEVNLLATAGFLAITSTIADSQVTIDGTFVGVAPYEGELLVGTHEVRVTKLCYKDHIESIDAKAGAEYRLDIKMEELPPALNPCVKKETVGYTPVYKRKWFPIAIGGAGAAVIGGVAFLLSFPCTSPFRKPFDCPVSPATDLVVR